MSVYVLDESHPWNDYVLDEGYLLSGYVLDEGYLLSGYVLDEGYLLSGYVLDEGYLLRGQEELTGQQIMGGRPLCRYFIGQLLHCLCLQRDKSIRIPTVTLHHQFHFKLPSNTRGAIPLQTAQQYLGCSSTSNCLIILGVQFHFKLHNNNTGAIPLKIAQQY